MLYDALRNSATRRRIAGPAVALALASTLLAAPLALAPASPAFAQARPTNLADLVDPVAEAVVNISATQTVDDKDSGTLRICPRARRSMRCSRSSSRITASTRNRAPAGRSPWVPASSSIRAAS